MMARYQRQMVLPQVGIQGQMRLLRSRVLVVGAGALGSAAATYLAAAGVGTIGLVDGDVVELSNLHRQILHDESTIGVLKTQSAANRLRAINPDVEIVEHSTFLDRGNTLDIFSGYDVILNGSDNFPTRYLVNDAAVFLKKTLVDAAILRFDGQLSVFGPGRGCYRCLFPEPPPPGTVPDCAEAGIFGAVAGVLGSMEAVETIKVLLDLGSSATGTLQLYDALGGTWHRVPFHRDPDCVVCGDQPTVTQLIDYERFCGTPRPAAVEAVGGGEFTVDADEAERWVDNLEVQIVDVRDLNEFQQGHLPRASRCALEDLDDVAGRANGPVLVVCAVGVRSGYAVQYLRSRNVEAWTLNGGTLAWQSAGKSLVREGTPEAES